MLPCTSYGAEQELFLLTVEHHHSTWLNSLYLAGFSRAGRRQVGKYRFRFLSMQLPVLADENGTASLYVSPLQVCAR